VGWWGQWFESSGRLDRWWYGVCGVLCGSLLFFAVLCCSLLFFAVLCCSLCSFSFFVGVFWFMFCSMFNWCCLGFHLWHCALMLCMPCPVHPVLASSSTAGEHFTRAELIEKPIKEHRQSQWSWQFFEKEVPIPEGLKERLDRGEKVHYFWLWGVR
jgi:hypothetical protein